MRRFGVNNDCLMNYASNGSDRWDARLLDLNYPMFDALLPVSGVYLRLLLQDLEQGRAEGRRQNAMDMDGLSAGGAPPVTVAELTTVCAAAVDRAVVAAWRISGGSAEEGVEEEEIILVISRVLQLLVARYP